MLPILPILPILIDPHRSSSFSACLQMWLGIQTRKQYLRLQEDFRKAEGGMLRCSAAEYWEWPGWRGWPGWQKKHRVDNCSKRSRRWWLFTTPLLYKTIQNLFDGSLGAPFYSNTKKIRSEPTPPQISASEWALIVVLLQIVMILLEESPVCASKIPTQSLQNPYKTKNFHVFFTRFQAYSDIHGCP